MIVLRILSLIFSATLSFILLTFLVYFIRRGKETVRIPLRAEAAAILAEVFLSFFVLLTFPIGLLLPDFTRKTGPSGGGRPILLLPGLLISRFHLLFMALFLKKRGGGPVHTLNLFPVTRGVRRCGEDLARFVEVVAGKSPDGMVDLVAFSMGGIIARYYIERMEGWKRVKRLITIATPHKGTALLLKKGGLGHRPDEVDTPEREVPYTFIYSEFDNLVIPCKNAWIEGRGKRVSGGMRGHLGLFFSLTLYRLLRDILEGESPFGKV